MLCFLELLLLIVGIVALKRGRLSLFGHWIVEGAAARLIGLLLVMPFVTVFVLGFIRGFEAGRTGAPFRREAYCDLALLEMALWGIALVGSGVIALLTVQRQPNRAKDEEEYKKLRYFRAAEPDDRARDERFQPGP